MIFRICAWCRDGHPRWKFWAGAMGVEWWGWGNWFDRTDGICPKCAGKMQY